MTEHSFEYEWLKSIEKEYNSLAVSILNGFFLVCIFFHFKKVSQDFKELPSELR